MDDYFLKSPLKHIIESKQEISILTLLVASILFRHRIWAHLYESKFTKIAGIIKSGGTRESTLGGMGSCDVL